ncbi:hypothetical protein BKA93DRAFT_494437 [Sparassis latifolia]
MSADDALFMEHRIIIPHDNDFKLRLTTNPDACLLNEIMPETLVRRTSQSGNGTFTRSGVFSRTFRQLSLGTSLQRNSTPIMDLSPTPWPVSEYSSTYSTISTASWRLLETTAMTMVRKKKLAILTAQMNILPTTSTVNRSAPVGFAARQVVSRPSTR